jgi:hypothetical protein
MSFKDFHRIDEVYHSMYKNKKTCLEHTDPDAAALVRHAAEERQREKERSRDYYPKTHTPDSRYYGDYPSSRSAAYAADDEDAEYAEKAKKHLPAAAKAIMHKLKLEHPKVFNPEKARAAVKHALGSATEEDCESWMQDYSHTPDQKKEMARYMDSAAGEAAEEHHCKYAAQGCDCGECEECQDNAMKG